MKLTIVCHCEENYLTKQHYIDNQPIITRILFCESIYDWMKDLGHKINCN